MPIVYSAPPNRTCRRAHGGAAMLILSQTARAAQPIERKQHTCNTSRSSAEREAFATKLTSPAVHTNASIRVQDSTTMNGV
eukprot:CAMPEP_0119324464 /NCGR_PEP_ID=MMETSP1333-20130426/63315_1 /TAXON_ID=418940 /ORGANISM="Scyphosphaera apsteinii, Strain RCC1455" /LENGTH=80 /DNA_ID=CAMNT_0007332167 /DNA_START=487 /DNA_END=729 /DNA_ORIENTATION=+